MVRESRSASSKHHAIASGAAGQWFSYSTRLFRVLQVGVWPFVDLLARIWLAQEFFVSAVLKLTHWQTALDLAANEYPVSWMNPVAAAYTGVTIELVGSVLLLFGLATRYAAVPMFVLSLVIQFGYRAFDTQLFWAALFGWYVIHGAGPLSLDRMLRKGLLESALPLAPRIVRASSWVRKHLTPFYIALVRVWLGLAAFFAASGFVVHHTDLALFLPISTAAQHPAASSGVFGVLLIVGLATRFTSAVLMIGAIANMMEPAAAGYEALVLAFLALRGAGTPSLDALVAWLVQRLFKKSAVGIESDSNGAPKVVIVGAGFGGLACAAALRNSGASITLIDRTNYHLFQPLLYQVATAALSPGDIATPVRPLFRDALEARVLLGSVTGVDTEKKVVMLADKAVPYDFLVLATGATHSYFGKDQWQPYAPGLKRIEDATEIRRKLLTAFELAEATEDPEERQSLLAFLIVGGGPTGVELAGAIAELARFGMDKEFRRFDPASARVLLVQSGPRLLPAFNEKLAAVAQRSLEKLGVEVLLNSRVEHIDAQGVTVSGKRIVARSVLWAAGVTASPAAKWLKAEADNAGRIRVERDLRVVGLADVYAIGDTALSSAWKGQPVPGLAPAAKQGGAYVARVIRARVHGTAEPPPFEYRHLGSLATIGRKSAVADFGVIKLWGAPAWWLWGMVHVGFLVGMRNRMSTVINWFWAYLTFGGGIRLITGGDAQPSVVGARSPSPDVASVRVA